MNKELVSIIIPVYNVEKYLKECIESVLKQSYKNLEIILIDDGSPDNSGKICDEYALKDQRIKVVHRKNEGVSSARNYGLSIAKGKYISFIDSDDYVSSEFIENLYRIIIENDVEIAESNFIRFVDNVKVNSEEEKVELFTSYEMQKRIYSRPHTVRTVVIWNKLYKKEVIGDLVFPLQKRNEDEFFIYKVFDKTKKKIAVTNKILYYYRNNPNSMMERKFNSERLHIIEALAERLEYYKQRKMHDLYNLTIKEYLTTLKKSYILVKENIDCPETYLNNILSELRKNWKNCIFNEYLKIGEKIKILIFMIVPNIYYTLIKKNKSINLKNKTR